MGPQHPIPDRPAQLRDIPLNYHLVALLGACSSHNASTIRSVLSTSPRCTSSNTNNASRLEPIQQQRAVPTDDLKRPQDPEFDHPRSAAPNATTPKPALNPPPGGSTDSQSASTDSRPLLDRPSAWLAPNRSHPAIDKPKGVRSRSPPPRRMTTTAVVLLSLAAAGTRPPRRATRLRPGAANQAPASLYSRPTSTQRQIAVGSPSSVALVAKTSVPQAAVQIQTPKSGFDWGDAAIGAAAALGLSIVALGGGVTVAQRRDRRTRHSTA